MAKKKKDIPWMTIIIVALVVALLFPGILSTLIESIFSLIAIGVIAFAVVFVVWLYFEKRGK